MPVGRAASLGPVGYSKSAAKLLKHELFGSCLGVRRGSGACHDDQRG
jgi:hypothetical protein